MVPEAPFEQTDTGLRAAGEGWYVLNARDARWGQIPGRMRWASLESAQLFDQVGVSLDILEPGQPMSMYHWETDQEDFIVLAGEALLVAEGQERPLRQWDVVHCPPGTNHVIVGAGDTPCVVFAVGARERHSERGPDGVLHGRPDWGAYTVDEAALRHGAGVAEETRDASVAYARFPDEVRLPYGDGWLPG